MRFLVTKKLLGIESKNPHTFNMDLMVGEDPWEVQDHTRVQGELCRGGDVSDLPDR